MIYNLLGYAIVDVNMRGTGCSGGAFDYFETAQGLDGYDVIETVAAQAWVMNGKVGMMGMSYPGITQLFVAETPPPSLAAIAPMSVIDDAQTTLYPGGILNAGFALEWAQDRVDDSQPASPDHRPGMGVEADRGRRRDLQGEPGAAPGGGRPAGEGAPRTTHYRPRVADPLSPRSRSSTRSRCRRLYAPPVDRRADRRPLPDARVPHDGDEAGVVHVHQRHSHRLARPGDVQPMVRLPEDLRREAKRRSRVAPLRRASAPSLRRCNGASTDSRCPPTRSRPQPTSTPRKAFEP